MNNDSVFCPGGKTSQSGVAVSKRYKTAVIHSNGDFIKDIPPILKDNPGPHVVPVWNSHQGSITAAEFIWDLIGNYEAKIYDIWPKSIDFWYVKEKGSDVKNSIIGSVIVAETQCSEFLAKQKLTLKKYDLTTLAYEDYKKGQQLEGVLIAPQADLDDGYEVILESTANPNNFTTFINFTAKSHYICKQSHFLTAIGLSSLKSNIGEAESTLFDNLFNDSTSINDIPRLIFVIKQVGRVGLLFEGERISGRDILYAGEEGNEDIEVYEDAGTIETLYSDQLSEFFDTEFPTLKSAEFITHEGVKTIMFACPILGIYTHGYEKETVEPVIRFYINKFFEAINDGIDCSAEQQELFNKYEDTWQEKKSDFIDFLTI